jgi:hypothetical protein
VSSESHDSEGRFDDLLRELARGNAPADGDIDSTALVGATLGHYRVRSVLGRGGMGTVLLAEDTRLLRDVALKWVRTGDGAQSMRDWVLHEARAAAAVVHPNVASVFGVEEQEGRSFIVMEYVAGRSLRQLISHAKMGWKQAWRFGMQIAAGLAHAHELGVIHRDLKPDNGVMARLQPGGGVMLDSLTAEGQPTALGGPVDVVWTRGIGLSPDGERIAIADQARRRLLVCSTSGQVLEELKPEHGVVQFAAWDGSDLIVSTMGGPNMFSLERWGRDGARSVLWTSDWAWLTHPVVSRDGQRLAFALTPFHGNVWSIQP